LFFSRSKACTPYKICFFSRQETVLSFVVLVSERATFVVVVVVVVIVSRTHSGYRTVGLVVGWFDREEWADHAFLCFFFAKDEDKP
jgi:hypothetical protein